MTISELITKLQEKQKEMGDQLCECYDENGNPALISDVILVNVSRSHGGPFYRVFIQ